MGEVVVGRVGLGEVLEATPPVSTMLASRHLVISLSLLPGRLVSLGRRSIDVVAVDDADIRNHRLWLRVR